MLGVDRHTIVVAAANDEKKVWYGIVGRLAVFGRGHFAQVEAEDSDSGSSFTPSPKNPYHTLPYTSVRLAVDPAKKRARNSVPSVKVHIGMNLCVPVTLGLFSLEHYSEWLRPTLQPTLSV